MKVIHIYGASGSGTTTLGQAISKNYGYQHMDTDDFFWLPTNPPFTHKREAADRIALMLKEMKHKKKVVISGSLCGWGDVFLPSFSLAVRIITPTELRIKRLEAREYQDFGDRIREFGDMYDDYVTFINWAKDYDNGDESMRSKAMHDQWSKLIPCEQVILDGTRTVEDNLNTLKAYL